jgi:CRP-like cAMP-binding protein
VTLIGDALVKHLRLIGQMSGDDADALGQLTGTLVEVERGEDILHLGEHPTHSVVVLDGMLQRYTIDAQGRRQIHGFYFPLDTPSLETLHLDYADSSLSGMTRSRVGLVEHADLIDLMSTRPVLLKLIWRETLVQSALLRAWLARNSQMPSHAAMCNLFCECLYRAHAAKLNQGDTCVLPITQEDLADALGMSSVHVNRTLMLLRHANLADLREGLLTVFDWKALVEAGQFDPAYLHYRVAPPNG